MISRTRIAAPILLGVLLIIALACQSSGANPGDATPIAGSEGSGGTPPPTATVGPDETVLVAVPAPIQSAEINVAESFPPQYFLAVSSGLPNGCVKFGDYEVARDGGTIEVTVTNLEPEPSGLMACDMRYGIVETNIALGSDFEPGTTYTVLVNDVSTSFTAQGQQQAMETEAPAPIVSVVIEKEAAKPPNSMLVIVSALPNGCNELAGHGVTREGDTITVEITNLVQLGVPCTEEYRTVETSMWIDGGVEPCKVYEVIVNGEPRSVPAIDPSITCDTPAAEANSEGLSDLVDELRAAGLDVEPEDDVSQPFFSVGARILKVNEEAIQVFEYTDETTAAIEAGRVSPDGHTFSDEQGRTFMDVAWIDTPHFLRNGNVIVLYVGKDPAVLDALHGVLGARFAGGGGESVETPMPVDEPKTVEVLAPIDGVVVGSTRSIPPDYFVNISSGLPNGCVKFGGYHVKVAGRTIIVTVTNTQPGDSSLMCTMQYGTVETRIDLGRDFEPGVDYEVVVNGATGATFHTPGDPAGQTGQDIDRKIEVKLHDTAIIESQDLTIEFIEVIEDSRCPANVVCIWAGRARVLIAIAFGGEELGRYDLALEGGVLERAVAVAGGYTLELTSLDPYPGTGGQGDDPDYVATLAVSMDATGANDDLTDLGPVELSLTATAVAGEPLTVLLVAELTGGPDDNRELYCTGLEWQFGDGIGVAIMPGCMVWSPGVKIPRHFEETYTYDKAGVYEVTFTHGPLDPITTTVEVR
jgi:hypothetical protein